MAHAYFHSRLQLSYRFRNQRIISLKRVILLLSVYLFKKVYPCGRASKKNHRNNFVAKIFRANLSVSSPFDSHYEKNSNRITAVEILKKTFQTPWKMQNRKCVSWMLKFS